MPWFPIPFILTTKDGETKTNKYTYTEVTYRQPGAFTPPPYSVLSSSTSSATSFYYYQPGFQELDTTTSPAVLVPPKTTLSGMDCNKIEYVIIPGSYNSFLDDVMTGHYFLMQYKLKMKLKPGVENRTVKVRFHTKYYSMYVINYFHTNECGKVNTWSLKSSNFNYVRKFTPCELSFSVEPANNVKITQTQSSVSLDHGQQLLFPNDQSESWGYTEYYGLAENTTFHEYEINFLEEDSSVYVIFRNVLEPVNSVQAPEAYYSRLNPEATHTVMGCCTIELENKNDIVYGEGFSSIYVGEDNVNSGVINNGENSPSAIYVGENLVWSK